MVLKDLVLKEKGLDEIKGADDTQDHIHQL